MRLVFVSTILHLPLGGADFLWVSTAKEARRQGHDVMVVVSPVVAEHPRVRDLAADGVEVVPRTSHAMKRGRKHAIRQRLKSLVAPGCDFLRRIVEFQPDRVILNQGGVFDFVIEPELIALCGERSIPVVLICHSNDGQPFSSEDDRGRALRGIRQASAVYFVSRHNLRAAERQLAERLPQARIIQNPLAVPETPPDWPECAAARFAVVSRLHAGDKGLDVLLCALAEALGDRTDWTLSLFGRGPSEAYLRALAMDRGIADRVVFGGFVDGVTKIWEQHHLLMLPSRIEGCALAMLEALHHARPVIAANVGGVDEWIEHGVSGYVCPAAEIDALAAAIHTAWDDRANWRERGRTGWERARAKWDRHPEQSLIDLLTQV